MCEQFASYFALPSTTWLGKSIALDCEFMQQLLPFHRQLLLLILGRCLWHLQCRVWIRLDIQFNGTAIIDEWR